MATESQTNANRENAQASTAPKTEDGKARSFLNNTKFGLFATTNCVPPEEQEDYEDFCSKLWTALAPAAEFIRNASAAAHVEPSPVRVPTAVPEPEKPAPTIRTQSEPVPRHRAFRC